MDAKILVLVVAIYDAFQAVLGFFLCLHVLRLPDVHARVYAFSVYNGMVGGYTENLVIRCTPIFKSMISCHDHLQVHAPDKRVLQYHFYVF